jgi:hypothetical protein
MCMEVSVNEDQFWGEARKKPDVVKPALNKYKDEVEREELAKCKELPLTEQQRQLSSCLHQGIVDFAKEELGLDLPNREQEIVTHLMAPGVNPIMRMLGKRVPFEAISVVDKSVYVLKEPSEGKGYIARWMHELVHSYSKRKVEVVEKDGQPEVGRTATGVRTVNNSFEFLNEALTEITKLEISARISGEVSRVAGVDMRENSTAYLDEMLFLDELTKQVAQKKGIERGLVLRQLQRSMFLGETSGLRIITDTLGVGPMKELARIQIGDKLDGCAKYLGMNEYRQKRRQIQTKRGLKIFEEVMKGKLVVKDIAWPGKLGSERAFIEH